MNQCRQRSHRTVGYTLCPGCMGGRGRSTGMCSTLCVRVWVYCDGVRVWVYSDGVSVCCVRVWVYCDGVSVCCVRGVHSVLRG